MKTALYRLVRGGGFVCTIRLDGRVIDTIQHANIGTLMQQRHRLHPDAVTVDTLLDPGTPKPVFNAARARALDEVFA